MPIIHNVGSEAVERVNDSLSEQMSIADVSFTDGTYLFSNGTTGTSSNWKLSEPIRLPYTFSKISFNGFRGGDPSVCFYDRNNNFISGESYNNRSNFTVDIPVNATYCRYSKHKDDTTASVYLTYTARSIKADLSDLKFSVSDNILTITDGTHTWTLNS